MFSHEKNVIKILYKNNTLERSTPIIWAIMMMIDIIGIVLWKKKTENFMWNQGTAHTDLCIFYIICYILLRTFAYKEHTSLFKT